MGKNIEILENFKTAITSTIKSIAGDQNVEVVFGDHASKSNQKTINLPVIKSINNKEDFLKIRALADSEALKIKCSDPNIFNAHEPKGNISKVLYKVAERTRYETVGAKYFKGVKQNLDRYYKNKLNQKIEYNDGDLINAIRASIAIPGVLSPVYINQRLCVDGGLVDPVPVESLYNMGADITIAVNLYGLYSSKHSQENYNIIDIVDRSAKIILNNIAQLSFKIHSPDILIEPPIDEFKGWDFHKSSDLIEIGYQETKRVLNNNQETLMKIINLTDPY